MSNETDGADLFRAAKIMHGFGGRWGIAGGWAIDLFVGRQMRPHADIDVAILRDDQARLRDRLPDTRVEKVVDGQLVPWGSGERLELPIHEVHATWPDGFHLEFLLNEWDRSRAPRESAAPAVRLRPMARAAHRRLFLRECRAGARAGELIVA